MPRKKSVKRFVPKKYPSGKPVPKRLQKKILNQLKKIEKDNKKLHDKIKKSKR